MTCKLKCTSPEEIKYTITMTATAEEFQKMRDHNSIDFTLQRTISNLLSQANQTFTAKEGD